VGGATELVLVEDVDRVRLVTFNRPEKANAFDDALYLAAGDALRAAAEDDSVSVVVLTGAGKVYSAGVDIDAMTAGTVGATFGLFVDMVTGFPKPLLAAVNGAAVGIGFTMLLHVDVVVLSEHARLRAPFTRMGVAPEAASSFLLPRRMGRQAAALAFFTSDWIEPVEAVEHGLAMRVCPHGRLLPETLALAAHIAEQPLPSLMATKRLILDAERDHIARAIELEGAAFAELLQLPGTNDRVAAQLARGTRGA
jgi:enoyl-CoA hydratase/carnithine racemase